MSKQPIRPPMDLDDDAPVRVDHDAIAIMRAAAQRVVVAYERQTATRILSMLGLEVTA